MAELFTPDQDMIDRYLQRRLSAEEEERFEVWLMDNPHVVESLHYQIAMRTGVKLGKAPSTFHEQMRSPQPPVWLRWLAEPRWAMAMAAIALLVLVTPAALLVDQMSLRQALEAEVHRLSQPAATIHTLSLEPIRGNNRIHGRIILGADSTMVVLKISIKHWSETYEQFAVRLTINAAVHRLEKFQASERGEISLAVNTAWLTPGAIEVLIEGDGEELTIYSIDVEAGSDWALGYPTDGE